MISIFNFQNKDFSVQFIETISVTDGVTCDTYKFIGDNSRDLAIIKIDSGKHTPLQKILSGESTVEGYLSGKGKLVVTHVDGTISEYQTNNEKFNVEIKVGEHMQWFADNNSTLTVHEICTPPYVDGRFENISM